MAEWTESEKHTHASVNYVDDAQVSGRKGWGNSCSNCEHFIECDRNSRCEHVKSPINPMGWCKLYEVSPYAHGTL